jgi:type II secretory ATPase GspE/PulE/Tfp pilus assembly ATPase PilB-like protein
MSAQKELLVIDDEPVLCRALGALFAKKGFRVTTATTAHEALERLSQSPDVVLLDLKLPDGSGLDLLSRLRARFPDLRVIVISALADQSTIREAFERGATEYLPKPFDFDRCFYVAMGFETVDLRRVEPEFEALARVPAVVALRYRALPVAWREGALNVALSDPLDADRLNELKVLLKCEIRPLAAVGGDLREAIRRSYRLKDGESAPAAPAAPPPPARTESGPVSGTMELIQALVRHAHANRASDLHLGIGPKGPWIRERIDGMLADVPVAPHFADAYRVVVSTLKGMAGLDVAEHRLPQQGRVAFEVEGTKLDLRLSIVPTEHAEHVAIRLIEPSRVLPLEQLGMTEDQRLDLATPLLAKATGLVLVTGPAGSGRSTTLYTFLAKINTGRTNIVTVEDPVECELAGITQIPVGLSAGLTMADGLRAALAHDPDVLMVGELPDRETATLAVRTALTGHLVLSTLPTVDASSAITRLLDLDTEPFFLCSGVSAIISQRLVRKICRQCREPYEVEGASLVHLGVPVPKQGGETVQVWRGKGCAACRNTGYNGRTGIFEVLVVDHQIRSLIIKRTSGAQIRQSAASRGMLTLNRALWQKVLSGETSIEELIRTLPPELR